MEQWKLSRQGFIRLGHLAVITFRLQAGIQMIQMPKYKVD